MKIFTEFVWREKLNSMNLLLYMAPIAVVFLLPATLIMEKNVVGITIALARDDFRIVWYLLFNSALAYFVNLTNFLVTKHTSALTLQVTTHLFYSVWPPLISHKWMTNSSMTGARKRQRCSSSGGFDPNIQESCLSDWNVRLLAHSLWSYPLQRSQETKQMKKTFILFVRSLW